MKVDLYHAPLSTEAEMLLQDPDLVRDLLIKVLEGGEHRHFQVKSGTHTIDVSTSPPVNSDTQAKA